MTFLKKRPLWLIKLLNFEYWSLSIFIAPIYIVHAINALRCRSIAYITAVNITDDFMGENKQAILDAIPEQYRAKSFLVSHPEDPKLFNLNFPVFLKPNLGERGFLVKKVSSKDELHRALIDCKIDHIVQEAIEHPIEVGVFYIKIPGQESGRVTSITTKGYLKTTGTGQHTNLELLSQNPRARFQLERLKNRQLLHEIPKKYEQTLVEPVGNHNKGTTFMNGNYLINSKVNALFNEISSQIEGFLYGRFDIKVPSYSALETGDGLKILELNLIMAEPTHIYNPGGSLFWAYRDMAWHWWQAGTIAKKNIQLGVKPLSLSETIKMAKGHVAFKKSLEQS